MSAQPRSDAADPPVRPGEEPWTDAELKGVRAELESEATGLRADLIRDRKSTRLNSSHI